MISRISGKTYRCGDHVDTDQIIPARYLIYNDPENLGKYAMSGYDPAFNLSEHDIIIAGINFGCGSSREHAVVALQGAGVKAVIAKSFARIFFRNAINLGMPIIVFEETEVLGREVEIDLINGSITSNGKAYTFKPYPKNVQEILSNGGLINYLKRKNSL